MTISPKYLYNGYEYGFNCRARDLAHIYVCLRIYTALITMVSEQFTRKKRFLQLKGIERGLALVTSDLLFLLESKW